MDRILFFCLLCVQTLHAQDKKIKLEQYFAVLRENRQFNGNVLVVDAGMTIYERSFGYSDFVHKDLNTRHTIFPIASLSKTITATAILQLAQSGKINIDDPAVRYLTEFPYPEITIKNLLSHTSGLPPYNAYFDSLRKHQPERVFSNADFMNGLVTNKKPLVYQPGEKGNYDNINFIVLALLLEKVSGMTYAEYIQKYILRPAGMTNTVFFVSPSISLSLFRQPGKSQCSSVYKKLLAHLQFYWVRGLCKYNA